KYPKLAIAYPSGSLPDLRGEFIRGWDDGRGVDSSRVLGASQNWAQRNVIGSLSGIAVLLTGNSSGAIALKDSANTSKWAAGTPAVGDIRDMTFDSSKIPGMNIAEEVRPRNIAFNYIVRAA
ncbi:phage tail protein, partial [Enterobacteriaceae bacterium C34B]